MLLPSPNVKRSQSICWIPRLQGPGMYIWDGHEWSKPKYNNVYSGQSYKVELWALWLKGPHIVPQCQWICLLTTFLTLYFIYALEVHWSRYLGETRIYEYQYLCSRDGLSKMKHLSLFSVCYQCIVCLLFNSYYFKQISITQSVIWKKIPGAFLYIRYCFMHQRAISLLLTVPFSRSNQRII